MLLLFEKTLKIFGICENMLHYEIYERMYYEKLFEKTTSSLQIVSEYCWEDSWSTNIIIHNIIRINPKTPKIHPSRRHIRQSLRKF